MRATRPGLLTATVRERPFAVLLLDEIEKAHPNIYNLCLQIFDAGRLTDAPGADRRLPPHHHHPDVERRLVGRRRRRRSASAARPAPRRRAASTILRELGRWFRPEFLNRLDRIVTFRPLAAETAEKIAQREVGRVLERGGIARRQLAVDVDPGVLPLLLREGYSPAFGARPLKRTVERLVLLPVARAIAAGRGADRFAVAAGGEAGPRRHRRRAARANDRCCRRRRLRGPGMSRNVARNLLQQAMRLLGQAAPLAARKSELLALGRPPGFLGRSDHLARRHGRGLSARRHPHRTRRPGEEAAPTSNASADIASPTVTWSASIAISTLMKANCNISPS